MAKDSTFTEPDDAHDAWIDVRMTDPEVGEWDIDAVVVDGQVEYVDNQRAQSVIASLARTYDVDLSSLDDEQRADADGASDSAEDDGGSDPADGDDASAAE